MDQTAPNKIAELLRHQDDLEKIAEIKQKLLREKAAIDGQLKAGVQSQIQVLSHGVQSLADARQRIYQVREDMEKIQRLKTESQESVEDFDRINNLSRVLQNFEDTQKFVNNFKTMSSQLNEIQALIDEESEFTFGSAMPNLLRIHYLLNGLRDVRDDAWFHAQHSTEDVRRTIKKHFAPLDRTIEQFDRILIDISENVLEILKDDDHSLVVRVAKIINFEERQDLVSEISNQIQSDKSSSNSKTDPTLLFKNKISNRVPRGYPARFFKAIQNSIRQTFDNCMEQYPPNEDPDALLDNLNWVFKELEITKEHLTKCVPERWNILDKVVGYFQQEVYRVISLIMQTEPTAATILNILDYVKDYYDTMNDLLGYSRDRLSPLLLDGKEDDLYDDYLALIVSKLHEWYNNFAKSEKEPFVTRQTSPETSSENTYQLQGEPVMFKLVKQQIQVAADSGQGRIVVGVIEECANILRDRQRDWLKVMKSEVEKEVNDQATENEKSDVAPGLFEHLIALSNDQVLASDYTEGISSEYSGKLSQKYSSQIGAQLDDVIDGFLNVAKLCTHGMIRLIFNDLKPAFDALFDGNAWYKGQPVGLINSTLAEYLRDSKTYSRAALFEYLCETLVVELVVHYVNAMGNRRHALKIPKGTNRIKADFEQLYNCLADFIPHDTISESFDIMDHIIYALESPISELPSSLQALRQNYPDTPLDVFEKIVYIRKDIDSKEGREIMARVRNESLSQVLSEDSQPSVFTRSVIKR
ncbi:Sec6p [Sugiyamaella lignohabitans]|uniref:Sec6p n=1 Tax=Sugiyamaella lignohabitans TaxID=796027 RepID=A0A167DX31_9ASCO|nr:Sec6p [Sugiyamaella lignohabitans]ANB13398.1 Sec6p [Sugiyamaella lignohabitans]